MDNTSATTQLAQISSDTAMAKFGVTAAVSGGTTSIVSGLTMNAIGIVFGMAIGLAGLIIQWYYKHRMARIEAQVKLERNAREAEAHRLMCERADRERAEHQARMGLY